MSNVSHYAIVAKKQTKNKQKSAAGVGHKERTSNRKTERGKKEMRSREKTTRAHEDTLFHHVLYMCQPCVRFNVNTVNLTWFKHGTTYNFPVQESITGS